MGTNACVQLPWKCLHVWWLLYDHWKYPRLSTLQWRHNGHDSVSNHQPHDCLLNRLFRRRSKKTSKLWSLALVRGIHRGPVNSPHKWPVTRKMFPFDDVFMKLDFLSSPVTRPITQHELSTRVWLCVTLKYPWYVPIASSRCITDMQMTLIHTLWVVWWKWSLNWSLKDSACGGYN